MRYQIAGAGGSLTALATPFRQTRVDWDALLRLSERQIARGTAALIVRGSTGEAAALTQPEYARAVHTVVEAAGGSPVRRYRTNGTKVDLLASWGMK